MKNTTTEGNPENPQSDSSVLIDIDGIVKGINLRAVNTVEVGKMEIGEYILDELFQGRLGDAVSRNPYKSQSLVDVSKHPDLMVDRRTLGGWVRAADLKRTLTDLKADCSNLTLSHYALLLRVTDEKTRNDLAEKASKGAWSVRRLTEKVYETKKAKVYGGRMKDLRKMLENPLAYYGDEEAKKMLMDSILLQEELESEDRIRLIKTIDKTRPRLMEQLDLLDAAKKRLVRIELSEPEPEMA
ncbi:DUF1016 domain-containing protein [Desulfomonile tiedjei]|uniref:Uncharacterized protein n=1 Tax=Desulfomonile tiedjei (strain ATCC 49306 / DSM 6799 / DCB-1) TaxID=706587 RepID=I4C959_DESTA|nr:DUF1016 domain-containing protein [Desulfomonile tiedjei]AFM26100.1 Protein of unknown function (DUF1016) [Desulfomonile tiedjei DSM 6799]